MDWLKQIDDNTLISKLSIPGTHNSSAHYLSFPSVKCQASTLTEQLNHGIRFVDFRVATPFFTGCGGSFGKSPEDLQIIHGNFPVRIPFPVMLYEALDEIYEFLSTNPSEIVLISLKPEGSDHWQGQDFPNLIWDRYIEPNQNRWFLENRIPKIGEARGKAVLFRRFGVDENRSSKYGIDASYWKYNTTEDSHGAIVVQDWCEVMNPEDIGKKTGYVESLLKNAVQFNATSEADQNAKLYVNFCS